MFDSGYSCISRVETSVVARITRKTVAVTDCCIHELTEDLRKELTLKQYRVEIIVALYNQDSSGVFYGRKRMIVDLVEVRSNCEVLVHICT